MRPIAIASASALLGAAALLAWLLRDPPGPTPESNAGHPDGRAPTASRVAPDTATPINSTSSLAARTASPSVYVQALAAGSLQPLTQASLTLLSGTDYPPTLVALPVSHADAEGRMFAAELPSSESTKVIRAPGYVPAVLAGAVVEPCRIELEAAGLLEVVVQDASGMLVTDARVILSRAPASRTILGSGHHSRSGIGHPLVDGPVWVGTTNEMGTALIDELPPMEAWLNIVHATRIPVDESGHDVRMRIQPGRQRVTFTLRSFHAAVFKCPGAGKVKKVSWSVRRDGLDVSPHVVARLAGMRETTAEMFPDCLVYAHQPRSHEPLVVKCMAVCEDDSFWTAEWPLAPIDTIRDPIYLEPLSVPTREVTLLLRDATGASFSGIPVVFENRTDRQAIELATGEPAMVPCGTYDVAPRILSAAIYAAFKDLVVEVTPTGQTEFAVTAEAPLAEVIVVPKLPSADVLGPVTIYLENELGQGPATANWTPAKGPVRRLLTAEKITVRVSSTRYEDVEIADLNVPRGRPLTVEVPLVARKPN